MHASFSPKKTLQLEKAHNSQISQFTFADLAKNHKRLSLFTKVLFESEILYLLNGLWVSWLKAVSFVQWKTRAFKTNLKGTFHLL